jgi:glycosyltransferase involved in cell wall biosynthesis
VSKSISVGVPVYNGENFVAECLEALAEQDYEPLDVLISDNASTDATADICMEFVRRDARFRYVRQAENVGAAANHNFVIGHTTGELYKTATHDDVVGSSFLRRCAEALDIAPEAVIAFPHTRYIDADGGVIRDYDQRICWTHSPTPSGRLHDLFADEFATYLHLCYPVMGLMRRDALRTTRGIQPFYAADATLLVELALLGDFVEVPEPLYLKRLHDDTSMRANQTPEDFVAWYDPRNAGKSPLPRSRLFASYVTAVLRAPLSPTEKGACLSEVGGWFMHERRWKVIGGELKGWATTQVRHLSPLR